MSQIYGNTYPYRPNGNRKFIFNEQSKIVRSAQHNMALITAAR